MKIVLISGPWSSGTSAFAGMMAHLGFQGLGPYFKTNDPRTGISYELHPFRDALRDIVDEATLTRRIADGAEIEARLANLRARIAAGDFGAYDPAGLPLFLKYPLSALVIPEICRVFSTRLLYVVRPFREIEATRLRRGWSDSYGEKGARIIYRHMFDAFVEHENPTMFMRFSGLRRDPEKYARQILAFAGADPARVDVARAVAFVRSPGAD